VQRGDWEKREEYYEPIKVESQIRKRGPVFREKKEPKEIEQDEKKKKGNRENGARVLRRGPQTTSQK